MKIKTITIAIVLTATLFSATLISKDAFSLSGSEFNPGRIIDDAVFYNSGSMDVSQIQAFLNSKQPVCDTYGSQPASDWYHPEITRAQLAERIRTTGISDYNDGNPDPGFHAPPYTCLKDYRSNTPQIESASGYCATIPAGTNQSAAQMIYSVARACGINPQVFIVLLEKEQSLVTDAWPLDRQFKSATGFACPDTADCNPAYAGLFQQLYNAGKQFKIYQANPTHPDFNYRAGRSQRIYYQTNQGGFINPTGNANDPSRTGQSACGYQNVYIENQATAALYIYTPYQPNQAALANLYSTGDECSAYGNRNFWSLFNGWFGNTLSIFTPVSDVRISPGVYSLIGQGSGKALDVVQASKAEGATLQIWDSNKTYAQRWELTSDNENYYTLKNINSGKVLDVVNASTSTGAKLQIWTSNNTCAQKWAAVAVDGNITFLNKCSGLALDVIGASSNNGTQLQLWQKNYTQAQIWSLSAHTSGPITSGIYKLRIPSGLVAESVGGLTNNGTAIQIGVDTNSPTQKWHISRQSNGYYIIRNATSGRIFDVAGASTNSGAKIQILNPNLYTCAQRWIITGGEAQGYTIQSACSDKVIDVQNGAISTPGTALQIWDDNGTGAQKWTFIHSIDKLPTGSYSLLTSSGLALDLIGGQLNNGTLVQLWTKNGSGAQSWRAEQQLDGYYTLVNPISNRPLDIKSATFSNGTRLQIWNGNNTCAQKWNIITKSDGRYEILSACSDNWAIDVAGGGIDSIGTPVQLWSRNGSGAQIWNIGSPW